MFDPERLARPNIRRLQPYRSARSEFSGPARTWLDANENPYDNGLNRYPDPLQRELKLALAGIKQLPPEKIFLGNGSDEAIDLLIRAFCEPGREKILIMPPTYDMYAVSAAINNVAVVRVPLDREFAIDRRLLLPALNDPRLKLVFICSPNNPTGNLPDRREILEIAEKFSGLVVVDEAYQDFAAADSFALELDRHPNLVVLQTFSKARALAGARLGMAFAQPAVIDLLNRIKPPYNINQLTKKAALDCLTQPELFQAQVAEILAQRGKLSTALVGLPIVEKVFPSAANFLLVRFRDPGLVYRRLAELGTILRDRSAAVAGCLRITVGTPAENLTLIEQLKRIENEENPVY